MIITTVNLVSMNLVYGRIFLVICLLYFLFLSLYNIVCWFSINKNYSDIIFQTIRNNPIEWLLHICPKEYWTKNRQLNFMVHLWHISRMPFAQLHVFYAIFVCCCCDWYGCCPCGYSGYYYCFAPHIPQTAINNHRNKSIPRCALSHM